MVSNHDYQNGGGALKRVPTENNFAMERQSSDENQILLHQSQVPCIIREPNVFSGYRRSNQSIFYYLKSIFSAHNESINVWTHMAGFIIGVRLLVDYLNRLETPFYEDTHTWVFIAGYCTCLALYCASVNAHLFHSMSELHHYVCFMFDYAAVGLYGLGTSMQHLYYCGEDWFFDWAKLWYMPLMVLLCSWSCWVSAYCKIKYNRPYPKIRKLAQVSAVFAMYFWIVFPLMTRISHCYYYKMADSCDPALHLHLKQIFWFASAGFFYGSDFPHRVWAGRFDFLGHGHQLFHVCIMLTTYYASEAVYLDMLSKRDSIAHRLPTNLLSCLWPVIAVVSIELYTIYRFTPWAKQKIEMQHRELMQKTR